MLSQINNCAIELPVALFLLLAMLVSGCQAERVSYAGYSLYRSSPQTEHQLEKLRGLMDRSEKGIQFWTEPGSLNHTVDMMVAPDEEANLRELLRIARIPTKKIMYDVEEVIKKTSSSHPVQSKSNRSFDNSTKDYRQTLAAETFFTRYSRYATIEAKLKELAKNSKITKEVLGKSFEGRDLYLMKVSSDPAANKPVIFFDAGHHAREWISHATLLYIMESLINSDMPKAKRGTARRPRFAVDQYSTDDNEVEDKQKLEKSLMTKLQDYDFWFVPVVNPDGYEYTHLVDRNWRKTRSRRGNMCSGVDPNRNYPHHWGESGTSRFSCSDIYHGPRALSEPEVELVAKLLKENSSRIKMYITLHAYSQMILLPYGYDRVQPDNYDQMMKVADSGANAIASVRGTVYKSGTSSIILYPAAGGADDYAHGVGIRQAFTVELPDTGDYGFLLPPEQIIPVGEETVQGVYAMIDTMSTF